MAGMCHYNTYPSLCKQDCRQSLANKLCKSRRNSFWSCDTVSCGGALECDSSGTCVLDCLGENGTHITESFQELGYHLGTENNGCPDTTETRFRCFGSRCDYSGRLSLTDRTGMTCRELKTAYREHQVDINCSCIKCYCPSCDRRPLFCDCTVSAKRKTTNNVTTNIINTTQTKHINETSRTTNPRVRTTTPPVTDHVTNTVISSITHNSTIRTGGVVSSTDSGIGSSANGAAIGVSLALFLVGIAVLVIAILKRKRIRDILKPPKKQGYSIPIVVNDLYDTDKTNLPGQDLGQDDVSVNFLGNASQEGRKPVFQKVKRPSSSSKADLETQRHRLNNDSIEIPRKAFKSGRHKDVTKENNRNVKQINNKERVEKESSQNIYENSLPTAEKAPNKNNRGKNFSSIIKKRTQHKSVFLNRSSDKKSLFQRPKRHTFQTGDPTYLDMSKRSPEIQDKRTVIEDTKQVDDNKEVDHNGTYFQMTTQTNANNEDNYCEMNNPETDDKYCEMKHPSNDEDHYCEMETTSDHIDTYAVNLPRMKSREDSSSCKSVEQNEQQTYSVYMNTNSVSSCQDDQKLQDPKCISKPHHGSHCVKETDTNNTKDNTEEKLYQNIVMSPSATDSTDNPYYNFPAS